MTRPEDEHRRSTESEDTEVQGAQSHGAVGRYRLLQKLGEGGMGEVWLAEQTEPVRRRVALKIVKRGMDTEQVVVRFEAERQALAMMDHPAIAKVFDAGATPRGRPFFAMEYVPGVPITEHCDRHRLTNRERLDLFVQVCDGVQHAHHKAVIHRDLKPSNVLVSIQDGKPVPKIIDFGVAKATARKLTDRTMHTQLGVMIGTPAYMSPEQAEMTGQDVDTRTDVYSLGVMLYELLVGALPFDPREYREAGLEAIARKIREDEPPRPSIRLSTLGEHSTASAKARRTELPALRRELSGDLDWITLKALEKDRTRRYGSPHDLAAEIGRYLRDEPVLASPPSAMYRARKFVQRHTWGVAAATVGVLALFVFGTTMAVQARRVAAERDAAEQARADLVSVVEFQAGMLSATDPEEMGLRLIEDLRGRVERAERARGRTDGEVASALASLDTLVSGVNATDLALRVVDEDILGRAISELDERFSEQPLIDAILRGTIGSTYLELGRYERAEPLYLETLETRRRVLGADHPETLRSMGNLGVVYKGQGRYAEAEPLYLETLETRRRVLGADHPDTLASMTNLANLYREKGRYAEAEPLYRETVETRKRVLGDDHPETLLSVNLLAALYKTLGRYAEAEPLLMETLEAEKRVLGGDHRDTLASITNLANLYATQGRHTEAEPLYLELLETRKRVQGTDHPETLGSMNNLASLYESQGRYSEAEPLLLETLETRKRVLGADHPNTLASMNNLANLYRNKGRYAEAEPLYRETVETRRRVLGDEHPKTLTSQINLGVLYKNQGRYAEAEPLLLESLKTLERVLGTDHAWTLASMINLVALYENQGRYAEAEPLSIKTLETTRRVLGADHEWTIVSMNTLATLHENQGRYAEAEPLLMESLETAKRVLGADHPKTLTSMNELGGLFVRQGRHEEADTLLRQALDARRRALGEKHPHVGESHYDLACLAAARAQREEALDHLREAMDRGWAHRSILDDELLDSLRGDPEFEAIVTDIRQRLEG